MNSRKKFGNPLRPSVSRLRYVWYCGRVGVYLTFLPDLHPLGHSVWVFVDVLTNSGGGSERELACFNLSLHVSKID